MKPPGRRKRGKSARRFMYELKDDMQRVDVTDAIGIWWNADR